MTINPKAKIKIEGASLVVHEAYQLDGEYYNIVLTDGNKALTKDFLKWTPESEICGEITRLYFDCVKQGTTAGLQGPLENVRFVYKKGSQDLPDAARVEMLWRREANPPKEPFLIGTEKINQAMDLLIKKFNTYAVIGPDESTESAKKEAHETKPETSTSSTDSLFPDWAIEPPEEPSKPIADPVKPSKPMADAQKKPDPKPNDALPELDIGAPQDDEEEKRLALKQQLTAQQKNYIGQVVKQYTQKFGPLKLLGQLAKAVVGANP